jgi:hypothetical protein
MVSGLNCLHNNLCILRNINLYFAYAVHSGVTGVTSPQFNPHPHPMHHTFVALLNCGSVAQVSSGKAESESLLEKMVKESRMYCYWALFFLLSAEVKHPTYKGYNEQHKHVLNYVLITGRYAQLATCQDCQHKLVLLLFINPHCSSYKITHCNIIIGNVIGSRDQFASITCSLLSPTHNVMPTCKMTRGLYIS